MPVLLSDRTRVTLGVVSCFDRSLLVPGSDTGKVVGRAPVNVSWRVAFPDCEELSGKGICCTEVFRLTVPDNGLLLMTLL